MASINPNNPDIARGCNKDSVADNIVGKELNLQWKRVVGPYPARDGHCACACGDLIYMFGGVVQTSQEDYEESNELIHFNPATLTWGKIAPSATDPLPRSAATMVSVGSKLFLFGGLNGELGWLNDQHVFDTETKKWSSVTAGGKPPSPRDKAASAVIGQNIYVFGGFGPQPKRLIADDDVDDSDDDDVDVGLKDYQSNQEAAEFGWFDDLFVFDTASMLWSQPMLMSHGGPTPRAAHALNSVIAGEGVNSPPYLIVFGGRDCEARQNDLYVLDTVARIWLKDFTVSGSPPSCRSFHSAATVDSQHVIIVGGRGTNDQHYNDLHVLDIGNRTWCKPMIGGDPMTSRGAHSTTIVGHYLIVYGGSAEFDKNIQQCTKYYNDAYITDIGALLKPETTNGCH